MKSTLHFFIAALTLPGGILLAQNAARTDGSPSQTEVKVGPVALSVSVSGGEGANSLKTPFLGVSTGPLVPQLRSQLNLPEGMGLSVEVVAQGSPAEKAGIKQYDVLKKFNDQMLCAQEQLAVLVKSAGKGAKVSLAVLRGGKELNLDVILGEHDAPEVGKAQFSINGAPGVSIQVQDIDKMLQDGAAGNLLSEILKLGLSGNAGKGGSPGIQKNYEDSRKKYDQRRKDMDALDEVERKKEHGAVNPGETPGSAQVQVFSIYPNVHANSKVNISAPDGNVEIAETDGKRTVKIKDPAGQEIYSGDLNTEADYNAVPEKFRAMVKDLKIKIKQEKK